MEKIDWSRFTKRISLKATKEEILSYFLSQELLEQWFLSSALFYKNSGEARDKLSSIEKGDSYKWMWHSSENVGEGVVTGRASDSLNFTFLGCQVDVLVKTEADENILELTQSEIPLDEASRLSYYVGCTRGWTFYLTNLKSIIEGGIDLRNRNASLTDVINT